MQQPTLSKQQLLSSLCFLLPWCALSSQLRLQYEEHVLHPGWVPHSGCVPTFWVRAWRCWTKATGKCYPTEDEITFLRIEETNGNVANLHPLQVVKLWSSLSWASARGSTPHCWRDGANSCWRSYTGTNCRYNAGCEVSNVSHCSRCIFQVLERKLHRTQMFSSIGAAHTTVGMRHGQTFFIFNLPVHCYDETQEKSTSECLGLLKTVFWTKLPHVQEEK